MPEAGIIECVPNFSEGRHPGILASLTEVISSVNRIRVLRSEMDADHNRSVVTIIGEPESVSEAIYRACESAIRSIDMNQHTGVHPRIGAIDVVPIIPISGVTTQECVDLARALGARVGLELSLPVYLYGTAAMVSERENLAVIRRCGYEGLAQRMETESSWKPDFGPDCPHPTAGAVAIGVRKPLIAYNINLNTPDVKVAQRIARRIRERDGGFRCVKALGLLLKDRGVTQVSLNLTDYSVTSLAEVFDYVAKCADEYHVEIIESELIGLINLDAILDVVSHYLKLDNLTSDRILDIHIPTE